MHRIAWPLVLALVVAGLDGVTKGWAERALALHEPVPVLGDTARLTLGYNTGAAFGIFRDGGAFLLLVTGAMIIGLTGALLLGRGAGVGALHAWALGLMLGGAVANFADRWHDGRVTDFLDVGLGALRWPTFNLADSSIVLGVTIIVLTTLSVRTRTEAAAA